MQPQASDRDSVARYVDAVRQQVLAHRLDRSAARAARHVPGEGDAVTKVSSILKLEEGAPTSTDTSANSVPYLERSVAVSLVQSALEEHLGQARPSVTPGGLAGLWAHLTTAVGRLLHPGRFTPDDPNWVIQIAESVLGHIAEGNHPFNPEPAEHSISDSARLVLVSDWGTGLPRAQAVAELMTEEVSSAIADGRDVHVIHLGDVYYSGLASEYRHNALAYWPVSPAQASDRVTSWALNGNHDMYSGGYGYFQTQLGDPRFRYQRSTDGSPTSYFRLSSPSWDFIGLDTSWYPEVLFEGLRAVLQDPQAQYVQTVADGGRPDSKKLALLSHHQYVSAYSPTDIGPELGSKLAPVLEQDLVTAWWWGHEHRCMGFPPQPGVRFPRCMGNGGVPTSPPDQPTPASVEWEERDVVVDSGQTWLRFGFTVLDLDGERIEVRYRNDRGQCVRTEEIA
jgi:Calcineurin-like phosphoesterase